MKSNGFYYGYPVCCIREFQTMLRENKVLKEISLERQTATKYGLVPCQTCAERITKGEVQIQDLILPTRQCKKPFVR